MREVEVQKRLNQIASERNRSFNTATDGIWSNSMEGKAFSSLICSRRVVHSKLWMEGNSKSGIVNHRIIMNQNIHRRRFVLPDGLLGVAVNASSSSLSPTSESTPALSAPEALLVPLPFMGFRYVISGELSIIHSSSASSSSSDCFVIGNKPLEAFPPAAGGASVKLGRPKEMVFIGAGAGGRGLTGVSSTRVTPRSGPLDLGGGAGASVLTDLASACCSFGLGLNTLDMLTSLLRIRFLDAALLAFSLSSRSCASDIERERERERERVREVLVVVVILDLELIREDADSVGEGRREVEGALENVLV